MIKRYNTDITNVTKAVAIISKSAKKRRSMAIAMAKAVNTNAGIGNKLVAIK